MQNYINFAYDLFKISHTNTLTQQRIRKLTIAHQLNADNITAEPSSSQHIKFIEEFEKFIKHRVFKQVRNEIK